LIAISVRLKNKLFKKKSERNEDQEQCYRCISEEVQRAQASCNVRKIKKIKKNKNKIGLMKHEKKKQNKEQYCINTK
jgi:nitrogen regulatory protein PII-like uncharacterized protein